MYVTLGVFVVLAALAYYHELGQPVFPVDDAYISLHSAEILWHGGDPRYAGTPALTGTTSPVHVALIATLLPILSPLWASYVAMWLGVFALTCALARLAFASGCSYLEVLLLAVVGSFLGETPHQLLNGLETSWAMAGVAWTLATAIERPAQRSWELPLGCGILPFLRPELMLLSLLLIVHRLLGQSRESVNKSAFRTAAGHTLGWFFVGAAPWFILTVWNTGSPLPTTIAAKQNYFAEGCLPRSVREAWTGEALRSFGGKLGHIAWAIPLLLVTRVGRACVIFTAAFLYAYYTRFPGALGHYEHRYLYIFTPMILLALASLIGTRQKAKRLLAVTVLLVGLIEAVDRFPENWRKHLDTCRFTTTELAATARWINEHVEPTQKVLVHDAGYVAFSTTARLADLVGLKTPSSLSYHALLTYPSCGRLRGEAINEIATHEQPAYLVVLRGWDKIYGISSALSSRGWHLEPRFTGAYAIFSTVPPPQLQSRQPEHSMF